MKCPKCQKPLEQLPQPFFDPIRKWAGCPECDLVITLLLNPTTREELGTEDYHLSYQQFQKRYQENKKILT